MLKQYNYIHLRYLETLRNDIYRQVVHNWNHNYFYNVIIGLINNNNFLCFLHMYTCSYIEVYLYIMKYWK